MDLLLPSRADDPDPSTGDITESDMKSTELGSDDEEHTERLLRVLDFGQEAGVEAEGQCHLYLGISTAVDSREDALVGW